MRSNWVKSGKNILENPQEALIHTGIVSIEAAIRQYVQKYIKTEKIKNIVDTFIHKIEEVNFKVDHKTNSIIPKSQEVIEKIIILLDNYVKDKDQADKRLKETENNIKWLKYIKSEVENILEI
jgi:vacuolar-type H+-ATPase subunit D/Vma8